jgi:hypothetical protein
MQPTSRQAIVFCPDNYGRSNPQITLPVAHRADGAVTTMEMLFVTKK